MREFLEWSVAGAVAVGGIMLFILMAAFVMLMQLSPLIIVAWVIVKLFGN